MQAQMQVQMREAEARMQAEHDEEEAEAKDGQEKSMERDEKREGAEEVEGGGKSSSSTSSSSRGRRRLQEVEGGGSTSTSTSIAGRVSANVRLAHLERENETLRSSSFANSMFLDSPTRSPTRRGAGGEAGSPGRRMMSTSAAGRAMAAYEYLDWSKQQLMSRLSELESTLEEEQVRHIYKTLPYLGMIFSV